MKNFYFGFTLTGFQVAIAKDKTIALCSKRGAVKRSNIAGAISDRTAVESKLRNAAGHFLMEAVCGDAVICKIPVRTYWVQHPRVNEPILGLNSDETQLFEILRQYAGRTVCFKFQRLAKAIPSISATESLLAQA